MKRLVPIFLLTCLGLPAQTLVSTASAVDFSGSGVTAITTGPFNCPAGDVIDVFASLGIEIASDSGLGSISDAVGDTFTGAGSQYQYTSNPGYMQHFYVLSTVGSASNTVTFTTANSSSSLASALVACYSAGALAVDVVGSGNSSTTGASLSSASFSTAQATEVVSTGCSGGGILTAGSPSAMAITNNAVGLEYWVPIATQSGVTTTMTASANGTWGCLALSFEYPPASPVITYVQGNFATPQMPSTSVTVPFTAAQTAGDLNIVVVGWNDSTATVSTVTDGSGNIYTFAIGPTGQSGVATQSIYYAGNISAAAAGANSVTVTFSTPAVYPDIRILEYSGADPNNPVDVTAASSGNSAYGSSGPVMTTNPTDLLFGANLVQTLTLGPGSGLTQRLLTSPDGDIAEDEMVTAIGSYSATATVNPSGPWIMQMVAFRTPSAVTTLVAAPIFSPAGGAYTSTQTVTISSSTAGVSIRYTLDGSTPSETVGILYTGPITVNSTATLNAVAYETGLTDSAVAAATFTIIAPPPTAPPPTITGLSPSSAALGTLVTITGTNFGATQGSGTVTFNGTTASPTSWSANSIATAVPVGATSGAVVVTVGGVASNGVNFTVPGPIITYVQGDFATPQMPSTSVTVPFTAAQTAGDLNVVVVGWNDSTAAVSTVTDGSGNTYTLAVGPTVQSGVATQSIYYAGDISAAAAGANSVTVTFSTAAVYPDIRILEYGGADPNNPVDVTAASSGNSAMSSSGSVMTTNAADLLFGANLVQTLTNGPGSGFTQRLLTSPDGDIAEDEMVNSIGSYTATAPVSPTGPWIMQMVAFRPQLAVTTPPTAPGNLTATAAGASRINLNWTASTSNVGLANYIVQRCQGTGCTNFAQIATPPGTNYNDTGLLSNTSYSYQVQAIDTAGNMSLFSNTATATTQTPQPPTAPSNLTATAASASQITLNWTASTSNVGLANYIVQRCQGTGCTNFAQIAKPAGTNYNDASLSSDTSYSYQVQAIDTAGNISTFSNTATATTQTPQPPTAPSNLTAMAASGSQIDLSWAASTSSVGLANYIVQRCQGVGCTNFAQIATPTGTNYNDTGLSSNTSYSYQVQAIDTAGNASPYSSVASATTGYLLPLKASSDNRYLVDQNGTPFLIMGDAPQSLVGNLSPTDMATYMANREGLGFNSIWVNLLCTTYTACNANGTSYNGIAPFTSGSSPSNYDLSTPNDAYFSLVDSMVNLAATYNLVVFLDPIETGGWLGTLENNGSTNAYNYGVYIGTRYQNFANIVWLQGNDFQTWSSSSTDNNLVMQVMAGIASVDSNHLQTIELNYLSSYSNQDSALGSLLTLDSAYTYFETYDIVLQSYNSSPTIPTYLVEANYEYENDTGGLLSPAGPYVLREQAYWTILSGGAGQLYGNHYTWTFTTGWQSYLDSPGALEIQYINQLFGSIAWWDLVPDTVHEVVTAGYGTYNGSNENLTAATYCTTSWISGSLALTYCPNASTLTVQLATFSGPVTAQWYDPSNGTYIAISGSPFANSGDQEFTTPGNNHDGDPDWVLVLHR